MCVCVSSGFVPVQTIGAPRYVKSVGFEMNEDYMLLVNCKIESSECGDVGSAFTCRCRTSEIEMKTQPQTQKQGAESRLDFTDDQSEA